jgi:hypothetical protein
MLLFQDSSDASHSQTSSRETRETKFVRKKDDSLPGTTGKNRVCSVLFAEKTRVAGMRLFFVFEVRARRVCVSITAKDTCFHFKCPEREDSD